MLLKMDGLAGKDKLKKELNSLFVTIILNE